MEELCSRRELDPEDKQLEGEVEWGKNFYKWKELQVQAIFKNIAAWVAGRRVTAVFRYFPEVMNTKSHLAVVRGGKGVLCGSCFLLEELG